MNYSQEILSLTERDFANEELKVLCKTYSRIIESGNYKDLDSTVKSFLEEVNSLNLSEDAKNVVASQFKISRLNDLELKESFKAITESYTQKDDILYKERLSEVETLVNENTDYKNIDRVIDIYKSLTNEAVVVEQIALLEAHRDRFTDDIEVAKIINYLQNSEDLKKYKETTNKCVESLKDYLAEPNSETRMNALECLREIGYDAVVKQFMNYLSALNFADDTYGTHRHLQGSMATERVISGGALEKYINGEVKAGLGKIVVESFDEANEIIKTVGTRTTLKLLIERLSSEELNESEKELLNTLKESYSTWDLGLSSAIENLKESVVSKTPNFRSAVNLIKENINSDLPDRKIIHEAFGILSSFDFDSMVVEELSKIQTNFENSKERILVENTLEYIEQNNALGINESLKKDLSEYLVNKNPRLKNAIVENHTRTAVDPNIKTFLSNFGGVKTSGIVNSNPNDFNIKKVYSIFESVEGKDHFVVNGNYVIRENDEIKVVKESAISKTVLEFTNLLEKLNVQVIDETTVIGNIGATNIKIKFDKITDSASLFINEKEIQDNNIDTIKYVYENRGSGQDIKDIMNLFNNISLLTEMEIASTIEYKRDPKVKATVLNLNGTFYMNLVNENIKLNKFSKTTKYGSLKNSLLEYMSFDVTSTFLNELKIEADKVDTLKEEASDLYLEITKAEESLEKLKESFSTLDKDLKMEGNAIAESFQTEIDTKKKEYRNILDLIKKSK